MTQHGVSGELCSGEIRVRLEEKEASGNLGNAGATTEKLKLSEGPVWRILMTLRACWARCCSPGSPPPPRQHRDLKRDTRNNWERKGAGRGETGAFGKVRLCSIVGEGRGGGWHSLNW